jgi:pimeloyl-ACP methyl ester carboxylesterase
MTETLRARRERFVRDHPARTAVLSGTPWKWHDSGDGEEAVVLLPGAVGGGDLFFVVFQELQAAQRVLAVDVPSVHDGTAVLAGLEALLDRLGVRRAILLGASFSGLVVQIFAQRYPARTRALILSHTGAPDAERAARERKYAARAERIPESVLRGRLRLLVRVLLRKAPDRDFWSSHYRDALARLTRDELVSRYHLAASLDEMARPDAWHGPVLIVCSDDDVVAKREEQDRLRARYPHAVWREFPRTGHSAYTMDPLAYAAAVRQFVDSLTAFA